MSREETLIDSLIIFVFRSFSINCGKKVIKDTALSVNSVSKVVQSGQQELKILHDISFKLERGKSMAVVGPSGCGKSTLLTLSRV